MQSTRKQPARSDVRVAVASEQDTLPIPKRRLADAVRRVLREASVRTARVSLAVVDDPTMHRLNREFLRHDYPTDVLSFLLDHADGRLEGEIIVSADTAFSRSREFGWSAEEELLLYVVHGALHLVGYDDHSVADRAAMRAQERAQLAHWGVEARYDDRKPAKKRSRRSQQSEVS